MTPPGRTYWKETTFLGLAAALNYADRSAISSVLPALRADLQLSDAALGLVSSIFLWSYALGSLFAGGLADRWSRTWVVIGSLAAWSTVTALTGVVNSLTLLLVVRVGLGLTECLYLPAAAALVGDYHGPATRARAMSFLTIGQAVGVIMGGACAGYLADHFGWRSGFWILGGAGVALALVGPKLLSAPTAATTAKKSVGRPRAAESLRFLLRVPCYHVLLLKAMLAGVATWIFMSWLPLYFYETYDMSLGASGFAGTFMLKIATILGLGVGAWISDRVSARHPQRRMLLQALGYTAAAPMLLVFLGKAGFVTVTIAVSLFSFFRASGGASEQASLCEIVPPRFRSTAVGIMNAAATAAGGLGVLATGLLKGNLGLGTIFAGLSACFIVAAAALYVGYGFFMKADIARARDYTPPPQAT